MPITPLRPPPPPTHTHLVPTTTAPPPPHHHHHHHHLFQFNNTRGSRVCHESVIPCSGVTTRTYHCREIIQCAEIVIVKICLLVGCLTSQQHANVSQGRICSDKFTCCHTEIEGADPTLHLTQSQCTDTGPTQSQH